MFGIERLITITTQRNNLLALVKEASEIMTITYAGNFPAGIESFLVRSAEAIAKAEGRTGDTKQVGGNDPVERSKGTVGSPHDP